MLAPHSTSLLQSCSTGQLLFQKRCSNSRNVAHLIYHLFFIQLQYKGQQLQHKGQHLIKMRWNCPICRFPRLLFYCYPCLIFQGFGSFPWSGDLQPDSVAVCYKLQHHDGTACPVCLAGLPTLCPQIPRPLQQIMTEIWRLQICRHITGKTNLETNFDKMPLCGTGILIAINATSHMCILSLLSFILEIYLWAMSLPLWNGYGSFICLRVCLLNYKFL